MSPTGGFLRIPKALLLKEARQHAGFLGSYVAVGAVMTAVGYPFDFMDVVFLAIVMVPFFLGVQVFGADMTDGTDRFAAGLPVRPGSVWFAKTAFGLVAGVLLFAVLYATLFGANAILVVTRGGRLGEGNSLALLDALPFFALYFAVSFAGAVACVHVLRRPVPAVLLAVPVSLLALLASATIGAYADPPAGLQVAFLLAHSALLLAGSFHVFTRGRGHEGFLRDRGIAAVLAVAPPAALFFTSAAIHLFESRAGS